MASKIIDVLGTRYNITITTEDNDIRLKEYDGFVDTSVQEIVLKDLEQYASQSSAKANVREAIKRVMRHEIAQAFAFESGLQLPKSSEICEWMAVQGPKIYAAWQAADALPYTQYDDLTSDETASGDVPVSEPVEDEKVDNTNVSGTTTNSDVNGSAAVVEPEVSETKPDVEPQPDINSESPAESDEAAVTEPENSAEELAQSESPTKVTETTESATPPNSHPDATESEDAAAEASTGIETT